MAKRTRTIDTRTSTTNNDTILNSEEHLSSHLLYATDTQRYMIESMLHFYKVQQLQSTHLVPTNVANPFTYHLKTKKLDHCDHSISIRDLCPIYINIETNNAENNSLYENNENITNNQQPGRNDIRNRRITYVKQGISRGHFQCNGLISKNLWCLHDSLCMAVLSNGLLAKFDTNSGRIVSTFGSPDTDSSFKNTYIVPMWNNCIITLALYFGKFRPERNSIKAILRCYNTENGEIIKELSHHRFSLLSVCPISHKNRIVCGTDCFKARIAIWDVFKRSEWYYPDLFRGSIWAMDSFLPHHIQYDEKRNLICMASFNSNQIVICDDHCKKILYVLQLNTERDVRSPDVIMQRPGIYSLHIGRNSDYIFAGMRNGIIKQFDLRKMKYCQTLFCHNQSAIVTQLAYDSVNSTLFALQHDYPQPAREEEPCRKVEEVEIFKNVSLISTFIMRSSTNFKILSRRTYVEKDSIQCLKILTKPFMARARRLSFQMYHLKLFTQESNFADVFFVFQA
jgi:hypothetical protein